MASVAHPIVDQLRFTRSEWLRALDGTPEADALTRLGPMNSIGWIVAHLGWQEQRNFLTRAQGITPVPILDEIAPNGGPATTPPLGEMLVAWRQVTGEADAWLDTLTTATLLEPLPAPGPPRTKADAIRRTTYHYWFHAGEILAIRQILGHPNLPEFVGELERKAPYRPEAD
jgi:DinB superfamily